jgi:hypothetical protein
MGRFGVIGRPCERGCSWLGTTVGACWPSSPALWSLGSCGVAAHCDRNRQPRAREWQSEGAKRHSFSGLVNHLANRSCRGGVAALLYPICPLIRFYRAGTSQSRLLSTSFIRKDNIAPPQMCFAIPSWRWFAQVPFKLLKSLDSGFRMRRFAQVAQVPRKLLMPLEHTYYSGLSSFSRVTPHTP